MFIFLKKYGIVIPLSTKLLEKKNTRLEGQHAEGKEKGKVRKGLEGKGWGLGHKAGCQKRWGVLDQVASE